MKTEPELLAEMIKYLKFTNILQVSVITFGIIGLLIFE